MRNILIHKQAFAVTVAMSAVLAGLLLILAGGPSALANGQSTTSLRSVQLDSNKGSAATMSNDPTLCPVGQIPLLQIDRYPTPESQASATLSDAVHSIDAAASMLTQKALAPGLQHGPVWVTASDGNTFIVNPLGAGWFASQAKLLACKPASEVLPTRAP